MSDLPFHDIIRHCDSTALENAVFKIPMEILVLSPEEIEARANITPVLGKLRLSFWKLVRESQETGKPFKLKTVYTGICTYANLRNYILNDPYKLCWLLTSPIHMEFENRMMLDIAMDEVRDILDRPMIDDKGKFDHKLASLKLRAFESLHMKVYPEQKEKPASPHVPKEALQRRAAIDEMSMEQIEARIAELTQKN
jgi:hypothetical protein